ncbi:hypothetical protein IGI04_007441, partial [Brassica rapa subsp. trilocularis]
MALHEFLSYGPQKDGANVKPMFRKTKDGRIFEWKVVKDDPLCILQDAFVKVKRSVGFNIGLKFDDILCMEKKSYVVNEHAEGRPIIFSSFHPDAALLIRNMQIKGGLQGIVEQRTPNAVQRVKDSKLSLISYGQL